MKDVETGGEHGKRLTFQKKETPNYVTAYVTVETFVTDVTDVTERKVSPLPFIFFYGHRLNRTSDPARVGEVSETYVSDSETRAMLLTVHGINKPLRVHKPLKYT